MNNYLHVWLIYIHKQLAYWNDDKILMYKTIMHANAATVWLSIQALIPKVVLMLIILSLTPWSW